MPRNWNIAFWLGYQSEGQTSPLTTAPVPVLTSDAFYRRALKQFPGTDDGRNGNDRILGLER